MKIAIKKKDKIKAVGSHTVYPIMQRILNRENKINKQVEHFWVVGLDKEGVILYVELLSIGDFTSTPVNVPNILRLAIYKQAQYIILVHNHPSANLKPSENDKNLTEFIKHAAHFTTIQLLDHIIINEKNYFSFLDSGLLKPNVITEYKPTVSKPTKAKQPVKKGK